jgi:hypothetical protein
MENKPSYYWKYKQIYEQMVISHQLFKSDIPKPFQICCQSKTQPFWWYQFQRTFWGESEWIFFCKIKPYNCTPLCADLFIYLYEANFIQVLLKKNEKKLAQFFYFTFHYIYYIYAVLSLNNSNFGDFVDYIYPIKLEIKDTKYTARSASYLDLQSAQRGVQL